jgi:hypothetical protein
VGSGAEWVKAETCEDSSSKIVTISHKRTAVSRLIIESPFFFYKILFTADKKPESVAFNVEDIHHGICHTFAEMIVTGKAPLTPENLVESVKVMLAVEESIPENKKININELKTVKEIKSADFMREYREHYQRSL